MFDNLKTILYISQRF